MRATFILVLVALFVAHPVGAHHGDTLLEYAQGSGHFIAGLGVVGLGTIDDGEPVPPSGVGAVNLASFPFIPHPCHPDLQATLAFTPTEADVGTEEVGASVDFRFQVEIVDASTGERLDGAVMRFDAPGSRRFSLPPEAARGAPLRADLYMLVGADADWTFGLRGWLAYEGCVVISEVEANPAGTDAGNEWVELANLGFTPVDLSGWRIRATHGSPAEVTLPAGTIIDGGGHLVVLSPTQWLDNEDEVVLVLSADGVEYARTPPLTDAANDDRTNQLVPLVGGAWVFATGTPGQPN